MGRTVRIPDYHYDEDLELYVLDEDVTYTSPRYNKSIKLKKGYTSDGATGAIDINSLGWWVHDKMCDEMVWNDGSPATRWQGSRVLSDILASEGYWARAQYWKYMTFKPWKLSSWRS